MIIQCTHCRAKFKIPDAKANKDEIKARCAKCERIFVAKKGVNIFENSSVSMVPEPPKKEESRPGAPDPISDPASESLSSSQQSILSDIEESKDTSAGSYNKPLFDDSDLGIGDDSGESQDTFAQSLAKQDPFASRGDDDEFPHENTQGKEMDENGPEDESSDQDHEGVQDIQSTPSGKVAIAKIALKKVPIGQMPKRTIRKEYSPGKLTYLLYPAVVILAFLIGMLAIGLSPTFKNFSLLWHKPSYPLEKGVLLADLDSHYMLSEDKKVLFVIDGKAFNNSDELKTDIVFEAELYARERAFLAKEKFNCCMSISKDSIRENSNPEVLLANFQKDGIEKISPYKFVPFTLIFKNPDEKVDSYRINIIDGKQ